MEEAAAGGTLKTIHLALLRKDHNTTTKSTTRLTANESQ
jgi:hypothetical protein